jgi:hypothetical protein
MKRIGLVVAAAMLGTTGVASAGIAVHQFSLSSSNGSQNVALDAATENLAANCWVATGAGSAANCNTSASTGGLPGLPSSLDQVTGLVNADSLVHTAKGLAGEAFNAATSAAGATTAAAGGLPVQCDVTAAVPSAVTDAAKGVVPADVANDVNNVVGSVAGITGSSVGLSGNATGVGCSANTGGVAGVASGAASGAVNKATGAVNAATGAVNAATGVVNGAATAATGVVNGAVGSVTGIVNGAAGAAGTTAGGATGAVTGTVSGVTGTVNNTLGGVTGTVNGLLSGGLLNCSASGGVKTGLLGNISVTGNC